MGKIGSLIKAVLPMIKWALLLAAGLSVMVIFSTEYPKQKQREVNNKLLEFISMSSELDSEYGAFLDREQFGSQLSRREGNGDTPNPDIGLTSPYYKFYLFHVKNLGAVLRGTEKPKLTEMGPYLYEVHSSKVAVEFHTETHEVSYKVSKEIMFVNSTVDKGAQDAYLDQITTLNLPNLQLLKNLKDTSIASKDGLTDSFIAGLYANEALAEYRRYLRGPFVAMLKKQALGRYLGQMYRMLRRQEVPTTLRTRYPELLVREVPATLVNVYARVREEKVSEVVTQVYQQLASTRVYSTLAQLLRRRTVAAVPRVLNGLYNRMQMEALPVLLGQMQQRLVHRSMPGLMNHTYSRARQAVTPETIRTAYRDMRMMRLPSLLKQLYFDLLQEESSLFSRSLGICAPGGVKRAEGMCTPIELWLNSTGADSVGTNGMDLGHAHWFYNQPYKFKIHNKPIYGWELDITGATTVSDALAEYLWLTAAPWATTPSLARGSFMNVVFGDDHGWGLWRKYFDSLDNKGGRKVDEAPAMIEFLQKTITCDINASLCDTFIASQNASVQVSLRADQEDGVITYSQVEQLGKWLYAWLDNPLTHIDVQAVWRSKDATTLMGTESYDGQGDMDPYDRTGRTAQIQAQCQISGEDNCMAKRATLRGFTMGETSTAVSTTGVPHEIPFEMASFLFTPSATGQGSGVTTTDLAYSKTGNSDSGEYKWTNSNGVEIPFPDIAPASAVSFMNDTAFELYWVPAMGAPGGPVEPTVTGNGESSDTYEAERAVIALAQAHSNLTRADILQVVAWLQGLQGSALVHAHAQDQFTRSRCIDGPNNYNITSAQALTIVKQAQALDEKDETTTATSSANTGLKCAPMPLSLPHAGTVDLVLDQNPLAMYTDSSGKDMRFSHGAGRVSSGYESNPTGEAHLVLSTMTSAYLWSSSAYSFISNSGYTAWAKTGKGVYAPQRAAMLRELVANVPELTMEQAEMLSSFVQKWTDTTGSNTNNNGMAHTRVVERWRQGSCKPMVKAASHTTKVVRNVSGCKDSSVHFWNYSTTTSHKSPYVTDTTTETNRTVQCFDFTVSNKFEAKDAEIQQLTITLGDDHHGQVLADWENKHFKLKFADNTATWAGDTSLVRVNATAEDLVTALEAHPAIAIGDVTVTREYIELVGAKTWKWDITFTGSNVMGENIPSLEWSCNSASGCDYKSHPITYFGVRTRQDGVCETRSRLEKVYDARIIEDAQTNTKYSCDLIDMSTGESSGVTNGYEVNPAADETLAIPAAAAHYMWNASNEFSFLATPRRPRTSEVNSSTASAEVVSSNIMIGLTAPSTRVDRAATATKRTGFQLWAAAAGPDATTGKFHGFALEAIDSTIMQNSGNAAAQADAVSRLVAGVGRGITSKQVSAVATWVMKQGTRRWVEDLVQDDWRLADGKHSNGLADTLPSLLPQQLMPYYHWSKRTAWEYQYGFELANACDDCASFPVLAEGQITATGSAKETVQEVVESYKTRVTPPAAAKYLWNSTSKYSFLTHEGFKMWARAAMGSVQIISAQEKPDNYYVKRKRDIPKKLGEQMAMNSLTKSKLVYDRPLLCEILCGAETEIQCKECASNAKDTLSDALGQSTFLPWMDKVGIWILSLTAHPLTRNDQLKHWMDATCLSPDPSSDSYETVTFDRIGVVGTGPAAPSEHRLCVEGVAMETGVVTQAGEEYDYVGFGPRSPFETHDTNRTWTQTNCSDWTVLNQTLADSDTSYSADAISGGGRRRLLSIEGDSDTWGENEETSDLQWLENEARQLTDGSYVGGSYTVAPTNAPTPAPTPAPTQAPTLAPTAPKMVEFKMRLSGYSYGEELGSEDGFGSTAQLAVKLAVAALINEGKAEDDKEVKASHIAISNIAAAATSRATRRLEDEEATVPPQEVKGVSFDVVVTAPSGATSMLAKTLADNLVSDATTSASFETELGKGLVTASQTLGSSGTGASVLPATFKFQAIGAGTAFAPLAAPTFVYKVTVTQKIKVVSQTSYSCDAVDLLPNAVGLQGGWELGVYARELSSADFPYPQKPAEFSPNSAETINLNGLDLDVAVQMFDSNHPASLISFAGFKKWRDSYRTISERDSIMELLKPTKEQTANGDPAFAADELTLVRDWLFGWVDNIFLKQQLDKVWASRNKNSLDVTSPLDLDEDMPGVQSGFESNWDDTPGLQLSFMHASYLWNKSNTYSFLNQGSPFDPTTGGPTGFYAWRSVINGNLTSTTELALGGLLDRVTGEQQTASEQTSPERVCADTGSLGAPAIYQVAKCINQKKSFSRVNLVGQPGNDSLSILIGNDTNTLPPCVPDILQERYHLFVTINRKVAMGATDDTCVGSGAAISEGMGFQLGFGRGVYSGVVPLIAENSATNAAAEGALRAALLGETETGNPKKSSAVSERISNADDSINATWSLIEVHSVERAGCNWTFVVDANEPWPEHLGNNVSIRMVSNVTQARIAHSTNVANANDASAAVAEIDGSEHYFDASFYGTIGAPEEPDFHNIGVTTFHNPANMTVNVTRFFCPPRNGMSQAQVQRVAEWYMDWAVNPLLLKYVHESWSSLNVSTQLSTGMKRVEPTDLTNIHQRQPGFPNAHAPSDMTGFEAATGPYMPPTGGMKQGSYTIATDTSSSKFWSPALLSSNPSDPLMPHHMSYIFDVENDYSVLNPLALDTWRQAHEGPAPETALLYQSDKRFLHASSDAAVARISEGTNTLLPCDVNITTEEVTVEHEEWQFYFSWRAALLSNETAALANKNSSSNNFVFKPRWTGPLCRIGVSAGADYNVNQEKNTSKASRNLCKVRFYKKLTGPTVTHLGDGKFTVVSEEEWFVEGVNTNKTGAPVVDGFPKLVNKTVTTTEAFVLPIAGSCIPPGSEGSIPYGNGMSKHHVLSVATWLLSWSDHPLVSQRLQSRWWQQQQGQVLGASGHAWAPFEDGFALQLTYPGEEFMGNMQGNKRRKGQPSTNATSTSPWLPAGAVAALWDPTSSVSFLNYDAYDKIWMPMLKKQDQKTEEKYNYGNTAAIRKANAAKEEAAAAADGSQRRLAAKAAPEDNAMAGLWQEIAALMPDEYDGATAKFTVPVTNATSGAVISMTSLLADDASIGNDASKQGFVAVRSVRRWLESWAVSPYNQYAILDQWRSGKGPSEMEAETTPAVVAAASNSSRRLEDSSNTTAPTKTPTTAAPTTTPTSAPTPSPTEKWIYGADKADDFHPARSTWSKDLARFDLLRHAQFQHGSTTELLALTRPDAPGGCAEECLDRGEKCTGFGFREQDKYKRMCWFSGPGLHTPSDQWTGSTTSGASHWVQAANSKQVEFTWGKSCRDLVPQWQDLAGTTCGEYAIVKNENTDDVRNTESYYTYTQGVPDGSQLLCNADGSQGKFWGAGQDVMENFGPITSPVKAHATGIKNAEGVLEIVSPDEATRDLIFAEASKRGMTLPITDGDLQTMSDYATYTVTKEADLNTPGGYKYGKANLLDASKVCCGCGGGIEVAEHYYDKRIGAAYPAFAYAALGMPGGSNVNLEGNGIGPIVKQDGVTAASETQLGYEYDHGRQTPLRTVTDRATCTALSTDIANGEQKVQQVCELPGTTKVVAGGWELGGNAETSKALKLTEAGVSATTAALLWDPSNKWSFLHFDGFTAWMQGGASAQCDTTYDPTDEFGSGVVSKVTKSSAMCMPRAAAVEQTFRDSIVGGKCDARGVADPASDTARAQSAAEYLMRRVHPSQRQLVPNDASGGGILNHVVQVTDYPKSCMPTSEEEASAWQCNGAEQAGWGCGELSMGAVEQYATRCEAQQTETKPAMYPIVQAVKTWLLLWLDNPALHQSAQLQYSGATTKDVSPLSDTGESIRRLGYLQWGSAAPSKRIWSRGVGEKFQEHTGRDSMHLSYQSVDNMAMEGGGMGDSLYWAPTHQIRKCSSCEKEYRGSSRDASDVYGISGAPHAFAESTRSTQCMGYEEISAFCEHAFANASVSYGTQGVMDGFYDEQWKKCSQVGGTGSNAATDASNDMSLFFSLDLQQSMHLLDGLADRKQVSQATAAPGLKLTRGGLLLMSLLDQPYKTSAECKKVGSTLGREFDGSAIQDANIGEIGDGGCMELAAGNGYWTTTAWANITDVATLLDVQQYAKYIATRFVLMQEVIGTGTITKGSEIRLKESFRSFSPASWKDEMTKHFKANEAVGNTLKFNGLTKLTPTTPFKEAMWTAGTDIALKNMLQTYTVLDTVRSNSKDQQGEKTDGVVLIDYDGDQVLVPTSDIALAPSGGFGGATVSGNSKSFAQVFGTTAKKLREDKTTGINAQCRRGISFEQEEDMSAEQKVQFRTQQVECATSLDWLLEPARGGVSAGYYGGSLGGGLFTTQSAASLIKDGIHDPMTDGMRKRGIVRLVPDGTKSITGTSPDKATEAKLAEAAEDQHRAWGDTYSYFQGIHNTTTRTVKGGMGAMHEEDSARRRLADADGEDEEVVVVDTDSPTTSPTVKGGLAQKGEYEGATGYGRDVDDGGIVATKSWDTTTFAGRQAVLAVNQLGQINGATSLEDVPGCPSTVLSESEDGQSFSGGHCSDGSQIPPLLGDMESNDRIFLAKAVLNVHVWHREAQKALHYTCAVPPGQESHVHKSGVEDIEDGQVTVPRHKINLFRYRLAPGAIPPLIDISDKHHGLPLGLSQPHFLAPSTNSTSDAMATGNSSCGRTGCSNSVAGMTALFGAAADVVHVEGMVPIAIRHESLLDIEPLSGLAMNSKKRSQVNSDYSLWENSVWYDRVWVKGSASEASNTAVVAVDHAHTNAHRMWLPLYWLEEGGSISASQSASFKSRIYTPLWYKKKIPVICLLVGACAVSLAVLFILMKLKNRIMVAPVRDPSQLTEVDERFNAAFKPNSAFRRTSGAVAPSGMGPQAAAQKAKEKQKKQKEQKEKKAKGNQVGVGGAKGAGAKMPSSNPFAKSPKKKKAAVVKTEANSGGAAGKIGGGSSKKIVRGGGDKKVDKKKIVKGGGDKKKAVVRGGGSKIVRGGGAK